MRIVRSAVLAILAIVGVLVGASTTASADPPRHTDPAPAAGHTWTPLDPGDPGVPPGN